MVNRIHVFMLSRTRTRRSRSSSRSTVLAAGAEIYPKPEMQKYGRLRQTWNKLYRIGINKQRYRVSKLQDQQIQLRKYIFTQKTRCMVQSRAVSTQLPRQRDTSKLSRCRSREAKILSGAQLWWRALSTHLLESVCLSFCSSSMSSTSYFPVTGLKLTTWHKRS